MEQPLAFLGHPGTSGVTRVLWLGDPRALPAGGWTVQQGLAFALTPEGLPDSAQVFTPAGAGPAQLVADAVRLAVSGGTVHLGRLLASAGVRYVVVLDGVAPSMVGTVPASVSAPPPPGLVTDLLEQDDLQVVPGELGVQVFENGEDMPVTAARAAGLPTGAGVVLPGRRRRGRVATRAERAVGRWARHRPGDGRHPVRRVCTRGELHPQRGRPLGAPAALRSVGRRSTPPPPGAASLTLSQFPFVPLAVALELAAWVVLAAALVGRPRRAPAATAPPRPRPWPRPRRGATVSPAHRRPERRWLVLALVVVVVVGVGIAAGARGTQTPAAAPATPTALVGAPDAESTAWYCTGQSTGSGVAPGFIVLTNSTTRAVDGIVTAVTDSGAVVHTAVSVPARGATTPAIPTLSSGSWEGETVTVAGGGVAVTQAVHGASGWSQTPCQSTTAADWYFPGGTTANSDPLYVSLLNPTSTPVVVDLSFVTPAGSVHPINYQGIVLQSGQVQVENVASEVQNVVRRSAPWSPRGPGVSLRQRCRASRASPRAWPWCPAPRSPRRTGRFPRART